MDTLVFLCKKTISVLVYPVGMTLALICTGLLLLIKAHARRGGILLIAAGSSFLYVCSIPLTSCFLVADLQERAGPYADPLRLAGSGIDNIVVLGGGARRDGRTPGDRVDGNIFRVMEGVRLWKRMPGSRIIFSGFGLKSQASDPGAMAELPIELGVPRGSFALVVEALDTADEARLITPLTGGKAFALVTSAVHMPRAMMLFRNAGAEPLAAPCEFKRAELPPFPLSLLPDAQSLAASQGAVHEYVGMLWCWVMSRRPGTIDGSRRGGVYPRPPSASRERAGINPAPTDVCFDSLNRSGFPQFSARDTIISKRFTKKP
ncbi:MAG: ElyC/SanA/YdcF family protein [Pseudomonadota bacterium]